MKKITLSVLIKYLLFLLTFLPDLSYSQTPVVEIDTAISRTRLYAALNAKNILYKREEYELDTDGFECKGVVLKQISDGTAIKGCRLYGNELIWQNSSSMGYMDDNEVDGIISTLKYISDSIDLQKRPQQDVWIYYKTVDDFEIGVKAARGKRYELYFRKNYRISVEKSVLLGGSNLQKTYKAFVIIRDFLKSH